MFASPSLDSAADMLRWSNRIYVSGAVLTLASAAMVLYEKHSKNHGRAVRWAVRTEITVIVAAFISLAGTIGAIQFGNLVGHLKDVELDVYKTSAMLKIAQANKDASDANKLAANAFASAGVAGTSAATAVMQAKYANELALRSTITAVNASNRAVTLQSNTAALQGNLEVERSARLAMQREMAPRTLTAEQTKILVASMQSYLVSHLKTPPETVDIWNVATENEAKVYSGQVEKALMECGLKTNPYQMLRSSGTGIIFVFHSFRPVPNLAIALMQAFGTAGIPFATQEIDEVKAGTFVIAIGAKPNP